MPLYIPSWQWVPGGCLLGRWRAQSGRTLSQRRVALSSSLRRFGDVTVAHCRESQVRLVAFAPKGSGMHASASFICDPLDLLTTHSSGHPDKARGVYPEVFLRCRSITVSSATHPPFAVQENRIRRCLPLEDSPVSDRVNHTPRASTLYTPGVRVAMADVMVNLVSFWTAAAGLPLHWGSLLSWRMCLLLGHPHGCAF